MKPPDSQNHYKKSVAWEKVHRKLWSNIRKGLEPAALGAFGSSQLVRWASSGASFTLVASNGWKWLYSVLFGRGVPQEHSSSGTGPQIPGLP